ncbi:MAG: phage major tail protein, TP901-1 family [Alphaproteobacteria bacterium]|nr:phage major tail protein, TP901-1 family [Alphaproteobacteria bacterium]
MTVQTGSALLLKMRKDSRFPYETVAGLRTQSLTFNANPIDTSSADSASRWRTFLAESGMRDMNLQGQGLFSNAASDLMFRELFFSGGHLNMEIILPSYGKILGQFAIAELQYLGDYDGEMSWRIELQSSGALSFGTL